MEEDDLESLWRDYLDEAESVSLRPNSWRMMIMMMMMMMTTTTIMIKYFIYIRLIKDITTVQNK